MDQTNIYVTPASLYQVQMWSGSSFALVCLFGISIKMRWGVPLDTLILPLPFYLLFYHDAIIMLHFRCHGSYSHPGDETKISKLANVNIYKKYRLGVIVYTSNIFQTVIFCSLWIIISLLLFALWYLNEMMLLILI